MPPYEYVFKRIFYIPSYNSFLGITEDFKRNPIERKYFLSRLDLHNTKDPYVCIKYNGSNLSLAYNPEKIVYETIVDTGNFYLLSVKKLYDSYKLSIDKFELPNEDGLNLFWYFDCWSKRRITYSSKVYNNKVDKELEYESLFYTPYQNISKNSVRQIMNEAFGVLYSNASSNCDIRRQVLLIHNKKRISEYTIFKTLSKICIIKPKLGWTIDYMSSIENLYYDLWFRLPYLKAEDPNHVILDYFYKESTYVHDINTNKIIYKDNRINTASIMQKVCPKMFHK